MAVVVKEPPRVGISEFAKKHGLTLLVNRRTEHNIATGLPRWYACLERCETKRDCFLESRAGNGSTPHEAIADYIGGIEGKVLVIDALRNRREIVINFDLFDDTEL
jgi:hypothetical protein